MSIIETDAPCVEDAPTTADVITAELVAKTIAGISQIGVARRTLEQAGWPTMLTANTLTVAGAVEAHLHHQNGHGWWQVYAADGTLPVWTVGARKGSDPSCWNGCLE